MNALILDDGPKTMTLFSRETVLDRLDGGEAPEAADESENTLHLLGDARGAIPS